MKKRSKFKNIFIKSICLFTVSTLSVATTTTIAQITKTNLSSNDFIKSQNDYQLDVSNSSSNSVTENINSFDDYELLYSSNIVAPIVTTNGAIGETSDRKSLTLTTFDGILVWNKIFANDSSIKEFYYQNYASQSISDLVINNYIYLSSVDCIVVLIGTSSFTNQAVFGINMSTGTLFNPIEGNDPINSIVKINDGIKYLYVNSHGDVIATKGNNYSDYVNSQYISMNDSIGVSSVPMVLSKNVAKDKNDYLLTIVNGQEGVNFAIFLSNTLDTTTDSNRSSTTSNSRQVYMVLVDDYLNPIFGSGNKIQTDIGKYTPDSQTDDSSINWSDILTYQTNNFNYTKGSSFDFFIVISGQNSSVYKYNYNISNKTISQKWVYSSDGDVFNFFSFNSSSNRMYISNKKSKKAYATGYIDLSSNSSNFVSLEIDKTNWNSSTYEFSKIIKEIPIISNNKLSVPDPYIVIVEGSSPTAKYFTNNTDIYNKPLSFKTYSDPVQIYKNSYASTLTSLPSKISDSNLISSLKFSDSTFLPTISITDRTNDDANGTITFKYKVTYENWYATGTTYSFYIAVTLTGFYGTSSFSFSWVTGLTGDTTNDDKWRKILDLKTNNYSYNITKQNIISYFANLTGTDSKGTSLSLKENMISLSSDSSGYSLTVTIDISKGYSFPVGITTKYTYTYSGFKTISGYDYKVNSTPATDISSIYPSQLTLSLFLSNFVTLGSKWSTSDSDWDYSLTANNLTGTATITLKYKGTNSDFPSSQNKTIVNSQTFKGFNTIPKQFSSGLSITSYDGILSPKDLWEDFEKNWSTSVLFSSLKFPYINNNSNLNISCTNIETANNDGYLNLNISIKVGTQTSLYVPGYGTFIYDENAQTEFKNANTETFSVKWIINQTTQSFEWTYNTSSDSSSIIIDLNKESFDGINKLMYANQVTKESIDNLYSQTGYSVEETMYPNVSRGTLTVVLNLKVKGTQDSTNGATETKVILITGFKVHLLSSTNALLLTFIGVICFLMAIMLTLILIYTKRQKFNYNLRRVSKKKFKKLKKIKK